MLAYWCKGGKIANAPTDWWGIQSVGAFLHFLGKGLIGNWGVLQPRGISCAMCLSYFFRTKALFGWPQSGQT